MFLTKDFFLLIAHTTSFLDWKKVVIKLNYTLEEIIGKNAYFTPLHFVFTNCNPDFSIFLPKNLNRYLIRNSFSSLQNFSFVAVIS